MSQRFLPKMWIFKYRMTIANDTNKSFTNSFGSTLSQQAKIISSVGESSENCQTDSNERVLWAVFLVN